MEEAACWRRPQVRAGGPSHPDGSPPRRAPPLSPLSPEHFTALRIVCAVEANWPGSGWETSEAPASSRPPTVLGPGVEGGACEEPRPERKHEALRASAGRGGLLCSLSQRCGRRGRELRLYIYFSLSPSLSLCLSHTHSLAAPDEHCQAGRWGG